MDLKETVKSIVLETIQAIKEEAAERCIGKVLFIFCDSSAHEPFKDQLIALSNAKITYDCLFLDGETSSWLGLHKVECSGAHRVIATDEYAPAPIDLIKDYEGIILPEIDLENAARIIQGTKGTLKSEIVTYALYAEKFVLVGEHLSGLKRTERNSLQVLQLPAYYKQKFQGYMNECQQLGMELVSTEKFADRVIEKLSHANGNASLLDENETVTLVDFHGRFLSADWVVKQGDLLDGKINLLKGTLISPLAHDILREKGIEVHFTN